MRPAKRVRFSVPKTPIFNDMPLEMFYLILAWVSTFRNLRPLRRICSYWKEVIDSLFSTYKWTPTTPDRWCALEVGETVRMGFINRDTELVNRVRFATGMCVGPGVGFTIDTKGPMIFGVRGTPIRINKHNIRRIVKFDKDQFLLHFNNGFRHHNPKWAVIQNQDGEIRVEDRQCLRLGSRIVNGQDFSTPLGVIQHSDELTVTKTDYGVVVRFNNRDMFVSHLTQGISMCMRTDYTIINASVIGSCIVIQTTFMSILFARFYKEGNTVKRSSFFYLMGDAALDGQFALRYDAAKKTLISYIIVPDDDTINLIHGKAVFRFTANMPTPNVPVMTLTRYGFTFDTLKRRIFGFFYTPRPTSPEHPTIQK